jgi:hypothetical protein
LQLALAVEHQCAAIVVLPTPAGDNFDQASNYVCEQFALDPTRHRLVPLSRECGDASGKEQLMQLRDRDVVSRADLLIPVSLRSGGRLTALMHERAAAGAAIDERFRTDYRPRRSALRYIVSEHEYNTQCDQLRREYLIHWTRASNSAWPDERLIDYYRDVAASRQYPRSAFDTLSHIFETGQIIASARHMASGVRSVAFTALTVREALPLMRWRARYRMMSFEPYGVGIRRETASRMGVKQVVYHDGAASLSTESERWRCQSRGKRGDWPAEKEYRYPGDLSLELPPGDVIAFCRFPGEAEILAKRLGVQTLAVTSGDK